MLTFGLVKMITINWSYNIYWPWKYQKPKADQGLLKSFCWPGYFDITWCAVANIKILQVSFEWFYVHKNVARILTLEDLAVEP